MNKTVLAACVVAVATASASRASADEPPTDDKPSAPAAGAQQDDAAQGDASGPNWARIAGVASVAVGVGFVGLYNVGLAQIIAVENDDRFLEYKRTHSGSSDVCDTAEAGRNSDDRYVANLCSKAETYEVVQVISTSAAALAITTGIFVIVRSGKEDTKQAKRAVDVTGGFGPGGGHLGVIGRF